MIDAAVAVSAVGAAEVVGAAVAGATVGEGVFPVPGYSVVMIARFMGAVVGRSFFGKTSQPSEA